MDPFFQPLAAPAIPLYHLISVKNHEICTHFFQFNTVTCFIEVVKVHFIKKIKGKTVNKAMKLGKYLLVPWFSLAVYTVLSIYNGPAGIVPYKELLAERQKILENLDKLNAINCELEGTMDALLYDPEAIRIRARELGYGEADERFVRIVGVPGARPSELKPGTIRTAVQPLLSGKAYRLISFCLGAILFSLFLAGDLLTRRSE